MVSGLWSMVYGVPADFEVEGLGVGQRDCRLAVVCQQGGFRVQGSWSRVQGSGFRVQGSGFRVQGSGFSERERERIFYEPVTSNRKLKASREGSK